VNSVGDAEAERIRAHAVALVWRVAGELGLTFEQSMQELSAAYSRRLRPPAIQRASRGVSRATAFAGAKQAIRAALPEGALASDELTRRVLAAGVSAGTFNRARFAMRESGEIEKCGGGGFGPPLTWRLTQADMMPAGARSP